MGRSATKLALALVIALTTAAGPARAAPTPPERGYHASLAGQLLVATPSMRDPNFEQTVVYLLDHTSDGALGVIVNRVLAQGPLGRLLDDLGLKSGPNSEAEIRLHFGGPVQPQQALLLHSADYESTGTLAVSNGVALTASLQALEDIAAGRGPKRSLLALGYAGWAPGQLETELAAGAWYTAPADETLIFDPDVETKWERALARRGVDL